MKVYLKSAKRAIDATAEYDTETRTCIVLKGSIVSACVSEAATFRGAKTVEKYREKFVKDQVVIEDVSFKSPSTAANFVTGSSTDGTRAWKTGEGITISALPKKDEG